MTQTVDQTYLSSIRAGYGKLKNMADKAINQLSDEQLHQSIDSENNNVAVQMKHLGGNMRSRFTNFLTSDGEKPNRQRDEEFIDRSETREQLNENWESGWLVVMDTLNSLTETDLTSTVFIRGEAHSVIDALQRQYSHYSYHVGQIVMLAKHLKGAEWQTLSIARGKSDEFNRKMQA